MEALLAEINRPETQHGDCLPSERELGEQFHVSRVVIRGALARLEQEGLIYRMQGKGAFVSKNKVNQNASRLTSFTQDMLQRNMTLARKSWQRNLFQALLSSAANCKYPMRSRFLC
jgi:GntR family transcriptional regulator